MSRTFMSRTFKNAMTARPKHVLSVSYDLALLTTRRFLLEQSGYKVTCANSFDEAIAKCKHGRFDLLILGHSIPYADQKDLIKFFRTNCLAPVLSLQRQGEEKVREADFYAFPDQPEELMRFVTSILDKEALPEPKLQDAMQNMTQDIV